MEEEEGGKQKFLGDKNFQIPANIPVILYSIHYKNFSKSDIFIRHLILGGIFHINCYIRDTE